MPRPAARWTHRDLLRCRHGLGLLAALAGTPANAQPLPPPPAAGAPTQMTLYLEIVVNERASGQVVPVVWRAGQYFVQAATLQALHVRVPGAADALVSVNQIPGVSVQYDGTGQRLKLAVPPQWLPAQDFTPAVPSPLTAITSTGMLLNYDVFATKPAHAAGATSVWSEQRGFGGFGIVSNTGVYRAASAAAQRGYVRYDTRWTRAEPEAVRTLTVGDLITASLPWGSSVRIGGVQLARNFSIRPDIVSYPLPQFAGQAAVPSAVDLFINGYKAGSQNVQPGPFTLGTMPYINGAGEASVVTTDAVGRQVVATVPFYVANTLLKQGTTDYGLSVGALRRRYGEASFDYGPTVASGALRWGLNDRITLEGRAEAARELALAGLGASGALGRWGVATVAFTQSHLRATTGRQTHWAYQYAAQRHAFSLQQTRRSPGYGDLAYYDLPAGAAMARPQREVTQANASMALGTGAALAAGFFDVRAQDGQRTRLLSLSYSRALTPYAFLSATANKALGTRGGSSLQVQLTFPLDDRGMLSLTSVRTGRSTNQQVNYSRNAPQQGGVGWSLSYADQAGQPYGQASASWRNAFTQLQAGVYGQQGQTTAWAGATGSLVAMDGGLFAANRVNDAFAVVSTGMPNVAIRYENQLLGRTDASGHLLVPSLTGYYPANIEVDTLDLPETVQVPAPERRVTVRAGSGAVVAFTLQQRVAARIALVDEAGAPLPLGLTVEHRESGQATVVGWDGLVYFEGLQASNELQVRGPEGERCSVRFAIDTAQAQPARRIGPLRCVLGPPGRQAWAPEAPVFFAMP